MELSLLIPHLHGFQMKTPVPSSPPNSATPLRVMPGHNEATAQPSRILVVDDDRKLCRLIKDYLDPLGYHVTAIHNGPDGAEMATTQPWQAVILDLMLPGCDGFEVLRRIRAKSTVPVLMLTARGDEADRIVGLEIGADDYLPKTFSTRELLARLRAVTRRSVGVASPTEEEAAPAGLVVGNLHINVGARSASMGDQALMLTPVEFDLLVSLAKARGRVKSREQLIDEIRSREYDVFDRSIDVHIASLRKKLGDDAKSPRFIKTIRAAGYMFLRSETA